MKRHRASNGTGERIIVGSVQEFSGRSDGGAYITLRAQSSSGRQRRIRLEIGMYEIWDIANKQAAALRARARSAASNVQELTDAVAAKTV